jgi:hypothetical protein
MATVLGLRGNGDWGTDERPKNFREMILWNEPNGSAPLLALMARMKEESVNDPEFNHWEETLNATKVTVNGTITSGVTALVVSSGAKGLVAGDLLQVPGVATTYDNEIVRVTTDPTTDVGLTIERGFAGSTAATITSGVVLTKIGSAHPEGGDAPTAASRQPSKIYNYCQIFKTTYMVTKTAASTHLRTGDPLVNEKKRKSSDHSIAMEYAFWLGKRSETTGANGMPMRTTNGILNQITTNFHRFLDSAGTTNVWNEDNLMDKISAAFDYTSPSGNERIVFAGNGALNTVNKLINASDNAQIRYDGPIKLYGMHLEKLIYPQGTLYLKSHPLFSQHATLNKAMVGLDLANIRYRPMKGRDTKFTDDIQADTADYRQGMWLTEAGLEFRHEETAFVLLNVGGAAL